MKIFIVLLIILGAFAGLFLLINKNKEIKLQREQNSFFSFYIPPNPLPKGKPGDIIRFEPMNLKIEGARVYRILYQSENEDKSITVSSGMIFIPEVQAPEKGRNIVAWAHGTTGMGASCAPSRSPSPLKNMTWISDFIDKGFVVVATDYSGLGTPGTEGYLIGKDEAFDVLNSVRAARNFAGSETSNNFALWGHSQGGHAVLFSANLAKSYAPELNLVSAAAAAPAAELLPLLNTQYNTPVAWGIGPEIATSWPLVYPQINLKEILSNFGFENYKKLAEGCILNEVTEDLTLSFLKQDFFKVNPTTNIHWYKAALEQTPKPLEDTPLFIAQGLKDNIVLPSTTALFIQKSCEARSNLTVTWLPDTDHNQAASKAGPEVASWLNARFIGIPAVNSCQETLPVAPALIPTQP